MWRTNTVLKIDQYPSLKPKMFLAANSSTLQRLLDWVNHLLIDMIFPAMLKNAYSLKTWLKRHPANVIVQHPYWQPQGSV